MIENQSTNPFKIGDRVVFAPDERSMGWDWPIFGRVRLKPGDSGVITRIEKDVYLYLDDERAPVLVDRIHLKNCQHSPHREQPDQVLEAISPFVAKLAGTRAGS
jgi:hypothetical protein